MEFAIVVPADEAKPVEVRQLAEERPVDGQVRELIGDRVKVLWPRRLHEIAPDLHPDLHPVLVVDDNGPVKGLPLNRRAGGLFGGQIAGDAVIVHLASEQTRDLSGFSRAEAQQLQRAITE